jgi:hypothetical protein
MYDFSNLAGILLLADEQRTNMDVFLKIAR